MKKKVTDEFKKMAERLNITHLSHEEQEEIMEGLGEIAFQRVIIRVLEELPPEQRDEFEKYVTEDDAEGLERMFQEKLPNVGDVMVEEIEKTMEDHKRLVEKAVAEGE